MSKRLCKMNHREIRSELGDIEKLVTKPNFMCLSCARSSSDKASLCKAKALTASEAIPITVLEPAKTNNQPMLVEMSPKKAKQQKKAQKKAKKRDKKLHKLLKAQRKLVKKQQKLHRQLTKLEQGVLTMTSSPSGEANLALH